MPVQSSHKPFYRLYTTISTKRPPGLSTPVHGALWPTVSTTVPGSAARWSDGSHLRSAVEYPFTRSSRPSVPVARSDSLFMIPRTVTSYSRPEDLTHQISSPEDQGSEVLSSSIEGWKPGLSFSLYIQGCMYKEVDSRTPQVEDRPCLYTRNGFVILIVYTSLYLQSEARGRRPTLSVVHEVRHSHCRYKLVYTDLVSTKDSQ